TVKPLGTFVPFSGRRMIGKDFFADRGLGRGVSLAFTGAFDTQPFSPERLPDLPATVPVRIFVVAAGGAKGGDEFWRGDAHDDKTFCGSTPQGREAVVRRSTENF